MTAEELPDASCFSFDVPEGAKNVIYRYNGFKALGIDAHNEKERKDIQTGKKQTNLFLLDRNKTVFVHR